MTAVRYVDGVLVGQRPRPLDPLTPDEIRTAVRVARADSTVRRLLGDGRSVLGSVSFLATKAAVDTARAPTLRDPRPQRTAVVLFYVYAGNYGVQALIDLAQASVDRVDRLENEPIPFAPEEVATARRMALGDSTLRRRLGGAEEYTIECRGDSTSYHLIPLRSGTARHAEAFTQNDFW